MRLRTLAWWHEVCQDPELIELRRRNAERLAALKATNSLIENERTTAHLTAGKSAAARLYLDARNYGGFNLGAFDANSMVDRG